MKCVNGACRIIGRGGGGGSAMSDDKLSDELIGRGEGFGVTIEDDMMKDLSTGTGRGLVFRGPAITFAGQGRMW